MATEETGKSGNSGGKYDFGVNVWKVSPGRQATHLEKFRNYGIFSLGPFGVGIGDLNDYKDEEKLKEVPGLNFGPFNCSGEQFIIMWKKMKAGDILLAYKKGTIADFGVVKSGYLYDDKNPDSFWFSAPGWQHYREVEWLKLENPIFIKQFLTKDEMKFFTKPSTIRKFEEGDKELLDKILDRAPPEAIEKLRELTQKYKQQGKAQIDTPTTAAETGPESVKNPLNIILYGPPGTGKTYATKAAIIAIEKGDDLHKVFRERGFKEYIASNKGALEGCEGRVRRVTFHPGYSYEDFIEGISASTNGNQAVYEVRKGVFRELAEEALKDIGSKYYLVIDEINRGNISKIFGELVTLVEEDKRCDNQNNGYCATLPYSKKKFSVPKNLYVIGTMNTSDRSIALVDLALRRRFEFVEMVPDPELLGNEKVGDVDIKALLKTLNGRIKKLGERDKQIGHAYFMDGEGPIRDIRRLKDVWFYKVLPLLNEYFYGRWEDIAYVLSGRKEGEVPFLEKLETDEDANLYDFKNYMEDDDEFLRELNDVIE